MTLTKAVLVRAAGVEDTGLSVDEGLELRSGWVADFPVYSESFTTNERRGEMEEGTLLRSLGTFKCPWDNGKELVERAR